MKTISSYTENTDKKCLELQENNIHLMTKPFNGLFFEENSQERRRTCYVICMLNKMLLRGWGRCNTHIHGVCFLSSYIVTLLSNPFNLILCGNKYTFIYLFIFYFNDDQTFMLHFVYFIFYFMACLYRSCPGLLFRDGVLKTGFQRRGSKLAWIVILSDYGGDTIGEVKLFISPFQLWPLDLWNHSIGFFKQF